MSGLNAGFPAKSATAAARGSRSVATRESNPYNMGEGYAGPQMPLGGLRDVLRNTPHELSMEDLARLLMDQGALSPSASRSAMARGLAGLRAAKMTPGERWAQTGPPNVLVETGWELMKDCGGRFGVHYSRQQGTLCGTKSWPYTSQGKISIVGTPTIDHQEYCSYPLHAPVPGGGHPQALLGQQWWRTVYGGDLMSPPYVPARMPVVQTGISTMVLPALGPILVPTEFPTAWPYRASPYRLSGAWPEGMTRGQASKTPPLPWLVRAGRGELVDRITISASRGAGEPPRVSVKLEEAVHRFEPPEEGKKEKKTRAPYGPVFNALKKVVGGGTELFDFINAVWWALPKDYKTPWADPWEQFKDLVNNYEHLDTDVALKNIALMEASDRVIGKSNQGWRKVAEGMGWMGPSPNFGGGPRMRATQPSYEALQP